MIIKLCDVAAGFFQLGLVSGLIGNNGLVEVGLNLSPGVEEELLGCLVEAVPLINIDAGSDDGDHVAAEADVVAKFIEALGVECFQTGLNAVNNAGLHSRIGFRPGDGVRAHAEGIEGVHVDVRTGGTEFVALAVSNAGNGILGAHVAEVVPGPAKGLHAKVFFHPLVDLLTDIAEHDLGSSVIAVKHERQGEQGIFRLVRAQQRGVAQAHVQSSHNDGILSVAGTVEGCCRIYVNGNFSAGLFIDHLCPGVKCDTDRLVNSVVVGELHGDLSVLRLCGAFCRCRGREGKAHHESEKQRDEFFHFLSSILLFFESGFPRGSQVNTAFVCL